MPLKNSPLFKGNLVPGRFSVIVPSFQQGCYLERTLISILDQKVPDLEIIVQDGGSTDQTLEILKKYHSQLSWISAPDAGQSSAINAGIQKSSGEFLCYLNSDDIFYPEALKIILAYFHSHPDAKIIYGDVDFIDPMDEVIGQYSTEPWNYSRLQEACIISQPACFWRRSIVNQFGLFNEALHYAMDYEYWLRVGVEVQFHYLNKKLAAARCHPLAKTICQRLPAHEEIVSILKDYGHGYAPPHWIRALAKSRASRQFSTPQTAFMRYIRFSASYWNAIFQLWPWVSPSRRGELFSKLSPPYPSAWKLHQEIYAANHQAPVFSSRIEKT